MLLRSKKNIEDTARIVLNNLSYGTDGAMLFEFSFFI
jgi:hypothetical protein